MSSAKVILETHDSYDELVTTCYDEHILSQNPRSSDYVRKFHFKWGSTLFLYRDGRAKAYDEYNELELTKSFNIEKVYNSKDIESILEAILKLQEILIDNKLGKS